MGSPGRRRAGRPSAAESAETRARILRAAREAFAARGYDRARNREIAEAAGVTSSALYHWFASKADLFAAVHTESLAVLLEAYHEAAKPPANREAAKPPSNREAAKPPSNREAAEGEGGAAARLAAVFRVNGALNREHPGLASFLALAPLEIARRPELAERVSDAGAEVPALFRRLLEEGIRTGELPPGLDLEATLAMLVAASFGLAWVRGQLPGAERHDAVLDAFASLLEAGLPGDARDRQG